MALKHCNVHTHEDGRRIDAADKAGAFADGGRDDLHTQYLQQQRRREVPAALHGRPRMPSCMPLLPTHRCVFHPDVLHLSHDSLGNAHISALMLRHRQVKLDLYMWQFSFQLTAGLLRVPDTARILQNYL